MGCRLHPESRRRLDVFFLCGGKYVSTASPGFADSEFLQRAGAASTVRHVESGCRSNHLLALHDVSSQWRDRAVPLGVLRGCNGVGRYDCLYHTDTIHASMEARPDVWWRVHWYKQAHRPTDCNHQGVGRRWSSRRRSNGGPTSTNVSDRFSGWYSRCVAIVCIGTSGQRVKHR